MFSIIIKILKKWIIENLIINRLLKSIIEFDVSILLSYIIDIKNSNTIINPIVLSGNTLRQQ